MGLNRNQINTLAKGKIPFNLQGTPFVIIHELVRMKLSQETSWEWTLVVSLEEKKHVNIDRNTALEIIRNHKMNLCYSEKEGQIYEIPGRPFHKMYASRKENNRLAS